MLRMLDNYFDDPRPKANMRTKGEVSCQSFPPGDVPDVSNRLPFFQKTPCATTSTRTGALLKAGSDPDQDTVFELVASQDSSPAQFLSRS